MLLCTCAWLVGNRGVASFSGCELGCGIPLLLADGN